VDDERQKQHISNAYDASYAQNLHTVTTQGLKLEKVRLTDSWKHSRKEFGDRLALKNMVIAEQHKVTNRGDLTEDEYMTANHKLNKARAERQEMIDQRMTSSIPAINIGALTLDQVKADTREDIVNGTVESMKYEMRNTPEDQRYKKANDISNYPLDHLSTLEKDVVKKKMYKYIADENSAVANDQARKDAELKLSKVSSNNEARGGIIELQAVQKTLAPEEYLKASSELKQGILDDYEVGFLTNTEKDYYLERVRNGDPVKEDNASVYRGFRTQLEITPYEKIEKNPYLTVGTKKKLIDLKAKLVDEGETWMKPPAYKEGKEAIMKAYGFTEALMFEVVEGKQKQAMNQEMITLLEDYKYEIRNTSLDGKTANPNHYEI